MACAAAEFKPTSGHERIDRCAGNRSAHTAIDGFAAAMASVNYIVIYYWTNLIFACKAIEIMTADTSPTMQARTPQWPYRVARWGLAAVFFWAGATKLADPAAFAALIDAYGLVPAPLLLPLAVGLPLVEVVAAVGLLADIRGSLAVIAGLMAVFVAILAYGIRMGLDVDCGCFGPDDIESRAYHGLRAALYRDIVMAAGIAFLYGWRRVRSVRPLPVWDAWLRLVNLIGFPAATTS
jgi:uncharacterized membrane protein YphA (DoxX/SURF4 family)